MHWLTCAMHAVSEGQLWHGKRLHTASCLATDDVQLVLTAVACLVPTIIKLSAHTHLGLCLEYYRCWFLVNNLRARCRCMGCRRAMRGRLHDVMGMRTQHAKATVHLKMSACTHKHRTCI